MMGSLNDAPVAVTMDTPLGSQLTFHSMGGIEALSRTFVYEIDALSPREDLDADELLGQEVTVHLALSGGDDDGSRHWSGRVASVDYVDTSDDGLSRDPREPNRGRLERAFQLESLEWPSIDGPRKVDALVKRIRQRTYDVVLVLAPYVFHAQSEPIVAAAKQARTLWALVDGYGVTAVRLGLERFLAGEARAAGPSDRSGLALASVHR